MMPRSAPTLVTEPAGLEAMVARLSMEPRIAVDTEADSLYSYYEKVCLIQFSIPGSDYILDTLALKEIAPLSAIFADPNIEIVFHASEYDIMSLKRDYQFTFNNIFDTMVAARTLGWKQVGLGAILEQRFGVKLDKRFQRADWGKRPLTRELVEYARDDTFYLLALHDLQLAQLERVGRLIEAREEFARLTRAEFSEREFDPNRYYTLPGARELDPVGLGALRELYEFREKQARKEDRPPFKIISNATLVRLAHLRPKTVDELAVMPGIGEWFVRRHGRAALQAIERGRNQPQLRPPRQAGPRAGALSDNATRERYARLKEWRKQRAEARGVEPDVIVSNDALVELARKHPKTLEALAQITSLGEWKTREYGKELLLALDSKKKG